MYSTSALTATNSTISGNSAMRDGGGIYNITGTLSLYSTTIAHNTADSNADGAGDGGGIMRASGTVALQNSILGANTDRGGQADDCAGSLLSQGYNLLQNAAGCTLTGAATADIVGQPPLLGPLGDNGGPMLSHALLLDSPAIDASDPAGCRDAQSLPLTTDQRGAPAGRRLRYRRIRVHTDAARRHYDGAQLVRQPRARRPDDRIHRNR